MADGLVRINKYLADRGIATRKDADALISRGLVTINGRRAVLGDKVSADDAVAVKGGVSRQYRYIAYNKPFGVITHSPQYGEKDIAASSTLKGLFPVGRLDKRSSGLIILTNDARITERLLSPRFEHEKEYRVTTADPLPEHFRQRMERGVDIGGYVTKPCTIRITGAKSFSIVITEGKKHQIRRMCDAVKAPAVGLERTRIMNIRLGDLAPNAYREVTGGELARFLKALGL